ncbi:hypothetical protein AB0B45_48915 [Nonomuraea sp. NPDC049152]|uniref:hypothetical protein n=1 Tax=Nonomuraea sp. NPDC049152 TaxID=3154350 RepID=UPI0033D2B75F
MLHHIQVACPPGSEPVLREFYAGVLGLAVPAGSRSRHRGATRCCDHGTHGGRDSSGRPGLAGRRSRQSPAANDAEVTARNDPMVHDGEAIA